MANDRFCCFRVHTIGMIIGWLGSISAVIGIVVSGFIIGYLDHIVDEFMKQNPGKYDYDTVYRFMLCIIVVGLILTTINLVASMLLIAGTVRNKHLLIIPWLINSFLGVLYLIVALGAIIGTNIHAPRPAKEIVGSLLPVSISLFIQLTIWNAIYKLYRVIRDRYNIESQRLLTGATAPTYSRL